MVLQCDDAQHCRSHVGRFWFCIPRFSYVKQPKSLDLTQFRIGLDEKLAKTETEGMEKGRKNPSRVSSHIQVLARRKSRDFHSKLKDQTAKDKALQHMAAMSSAQIVSATAIHNKLGLPGIPRPTFPGAPGFWPGMIQTGQPGSSQDVKPFVQQAYPIQPAVTAPIPGFEPASAPAPSVPAWQGRSIGTTKLRLVEFSAFLEQQRDPDSYNKHLFVHIGHANHSYSDPLLESVDIRQIYDKFPEKKADLKELFGKGPQNAFFLVKFWADLNCNIQDDAGAFYGVTSQYESSENMTVTCSTKVCSFGKQVVEKVETEYARFENGRFVYRINRSPMCEYMINFIHKLKHLPEKYMMNSVLENFTILLVHRLRELDREIDRYEAKVHLDRMRRHGVNYVQDTYLELAGGEESPEPSGGPDGELVLELERVRTQLSTSLYIGLRLNTDLEALKSDLDYSQQQWDSKERELQCLLQTLHTLELTVLPDRAPGPGGTLQEPGPQACAEVWVDQARGLAKSCRGNDEDSDTGLSSMHSQDSDSVPMCESLV
ncbi:Transcriptional enhancer factor TEF-1 [Tupaia chinensis]|uniref:Transcriptional enhancer factor TEF-1 n=1 Tax=Tupaia chinensis TaxID=246437 RepID=L9L6Q9_TUPCH|nr:Transcriptional enhancer factor TEF-1 [Tupaia chinensis]